MGEQARTGGLAAGLVLAIVAGGTGYWAGSRAPAQPVEPVASRTGDRAGPMADAAPTAPAVCPQPEAALVTSRVVGSDPDPAACASPYAGMGPVDLLTLPTDFDQTLALYTIAGTADLPTLRDYMDQSMGIALENERSAALSILFMRYGDLDPEGAINHYEALGLTGNSTVLYPLFSSWSKQDLTAAIARARALTHPGDRQTASRAIMRTQASESPETIAEVAQELDASLVNLGPQALAARARTEPLAAARTALALKDAAARRRTLTWIAATWAQNDADAALRFAPSIPDAMDQATFRQAVLGKLAEQDPEAVLRLAQTQPSAEQAGLVGTAMAYLARKNPARAVNALKELTPIQRQNSIHQVFHSWASQDPFAAAEAVEKATELTAQERLQAGSQVVAQLAMASPEEALAWAARMDGESLSGNFWNNAVASMPQLDVELAWSYVDEETSPARRGAMAVAVLGKLAEADPLAAVDRLGLLPAGQNRSNAISQIGQRWVQQDPTAAMDWLLGLPDVDRGNAIPGVAWQVAQLDVDLAASYVGDLSAQEAQHWMGAVMHQYLQRSPFEAGVWLEQYPDIEGHGSRMGQVAAALAGQDPRAAWKLVDAIEAEAEREQAIRQLAQGWSRVDPRAASRWWHRLDEADQTPEVLEALVDGWAAVDPAGARKWILRLDSDERRDRALFQFLGRSAVDAKDASRLIVDIKDEALRYQAYQSVAWQIAQYDRAAARDWLAGARLSGEQKQVLVQQFEDRR